MHISHVLPPFSRSLRYINRSAGVCVLYVYDMCVNGACSHVHVTKKENHSI